MLLLGSGGVTVYLGPAARALEYFEGLGYRCPERTNVADFLMDIISGVDQAETLSHAWATAAPGWVGEEPADEWEPHLVT